MQFSFDFDESEDYIWQSFTRKLQLEMMILFCGKLSQVAKSGTGLFSLKTNLTFKFICNLP